MKIVPLLAAGLLAFVLFPLRSAAAPEPPAVELITDTPLLQPTSTVEYRFARPMISRDDVGLVSKEPPVVITPAIAGSFTWLSPSSAVFVPDGPWPLGTEFVVSLRKGGKTTDGKPLAGNFRATLRTPPFARTLIRGGDDPAVSEPMPKIGLVFNLAVDLTSAQPLFQFIGSGGKKVAAQVRYGTSHDYLNVPPEQDDWEARWRKAKEGPDAEEPEDDDDDVPANGDYAASGTPLQNRLVITPVLPLTAGGVWKLEMKGGLKAKSGNYQIKEPLTVPLGAVRPFEISALRPESYINSGRSVTIEFSHAVALDITPETAAKFFLFDPPVPNLHFEGWDTSLTARGDFVLGKEYRVEIDPAVISIDGLPFAGDRKRTFKFGPVAPRLYLPKITGHQIRGGERKFEVLSGNLQALKVTAQIVAPEDAAKAVEAFKKYEEAPEGDTTGEMYSKLPPGTIHGKTVFDQRIELPHAVVDAKQQTALDWTTILGAKTGGLVFLTVEGEPLKEVGGKRPGAQALIQLTDLGVLWKKTEEGLRATVFSMATGQPVEGSSVELQSDKFARSPAGQTKADGTVTLPVPADLAWMVVSQGDDAHAIPMGSAGTELPMAAFRLSIEYGDWQAPAEKKPKLRGLIFTDRPLYRPGEMVHVKGIIRKISASGLSQADGLSGVLTLNDPRGKAVSTVDVQTDARGAFDTQIELGQAETGSYAVALEMPAKGDNAWQRGFRAKFEVADFQPNAFELEVPVPARLKPGIKVAPQVTAKYLFGAPVTKADVRWTLRYLKEAFAPDGFSEWRFGDEESTSEKILTLHGEGVLTNGAGLTIEPQLPDVKNVPYRGVLTVEATDLNQQTVSESRGFVRDAGDFYLGLRVTEGIVFHKGDDIPVEVIAVRPNGEPLDKPVDLSAELIYTRYETVRVQSAGKAVSFRSDKSETSVAKTTGQTLLPTRMNLGWETRDGDSVKFKAGEAGEYHVHVTAHDAEGHAVTSSQTIFVNGPEDISWDYRNAAQLDLVADKPEYRPGETARLLVKSPISGDALVTIERDESILRTMTVHLEGNAPVVEVPLEKSDAPNVFVSMVLIRGRDQSTRKYKMPEYRYGAAMLTVSDPAEHLALEIAPARPEVQPGEDIEAEVRVKDGAGRAVADAEVTFFAVDDGILALTGYDRPAPGSVFDVPFSLAVRTGLTLFDLLPEDPGDLEFGNKGYLIGGGGLEGPGMKLRRDFPGTAVWLPSLKTDAAGLAKVKFKAPDALTRYRLVAVAHAGTSLFGSAESAVTIRQPLVILSSIGQFANVGDELLARAVVRNDIGADGVAEVALELDQTAEPGKPGADALKARITVPNGQSRTVDIPVRLRLTGKAEWRWNATIDQGGKKFSDQVLATLKVGSSAPVLRETYLPDLADASSDLLKGVNPQLLEGTGKVTISVSNTRLASLREATDQLLEYPYGCAEQTVSALIPWALLPELKAVIPSLAKSEPERKDAIAKGLDRLFSMQTASGGLSYWPDGDEPSLFASAYGALVCSLLAEHQVELPEGHAGLLEYLDKELRGTASVRRENELSDRVLALYALALAGKAQPAYHEQLFRRAKELSYETRAMLALSINQAGGPAEMVKSLLDPKAPAPVGFSWFGGPARERAVQLLAWSRFDPKSPEIARLTQELLGLRANGHWSTTQQNAWALLALTRYYSAVEGGGKDISGSIVSAVGEKSFHVTQQQPAYGQALTISPKAPLASLEIRNPSKTPLFGEAHFVVTPVVEKQPRQDRGYAVSRAYRKLATDGSLQEAKDLKVGDRVLVTLRVETTRPGHFVAIDDPLPAIFEALNPAFKTQEAAGGEGLAREDAADYREIRADRVLYFCNHLSAGAYTFSYLARVRSAGKATAGSTKAEEMYRPERFGLGEATELVSHLAEAP